MEKISSKKISRKKGDKKKVSWKEDKLARRRYFGGRMCWLEENNLEENAC